MEHFICQAVAAVSPFSPNLTEVQSIESTLRMRGSATLAGVERGQRSIRQGLFPGGWGKALVLSQTSGVFQVKPDEQGWAFGPDF